MYHRIIQLFRLERTSGGDGAQPPAQNRSNYFRLIRSLSSREFCIDYKLINSFFGSKPCVCN